MRNAPRATDARVGAEQQQRPGRDRVAGARHDHRHLRPVHAREELAAVGDEPSRRLRAAAHDLEIETTREHARGARDEHRADFRLAGVLGARQRVAERGEYVERQSVGLAVRDRDVRDAIADFVLDEFHFDPLEQLGSLARLGGRVQTDVGEPGRGRDPAPGCALDEAAQQEERLVHVLDRLGRLAHRDRERAEPDRPADERAAQRVEDGAVDLVEAELVDLEQRQRVARRCRRSRARRRAPRRSRARASANGWRCAAFRASGSRSRRRRRTRARHRGSSRPAGGSRRARRARSSRAGRRSRSGRAAVR